MEKVTLTHVSRFTTKKDGTPLVSAKTGKPYTSLRIKTNEYGDKFLSGFDNAGTRDWKEGMTVELTVEKNGEYLNFSTPKKDEIALTELSKLANKHTTLELRFNRLMSVLVEKGILEMPKTKVAGTDLDYPEGPAGEAFPDDISPEDIPFN